MQLQLQSYNSSSANFLHGLSSSCIPACAGGAFVLAGYRHERISTPKTNGSFFLINLHFTNKE